MRITGTTRAHAVGRELRTSARRIETHILGFATFDLRKRAFVHFEMVALGTRSEFLQMMGGRRLSEARGIGFVLSLAPPDDPIVPPRFLHRYDAGANALAPAIKERMVRR